jgi:hypothetical protein
VRLTPAEPPVHLAGVAAELPAGAPKEVLPSLPNLLDHMTDIAALVLNACYDIIAWNRLAVALFEEFSALPPDRRNLVYRHLLDPDPASRHYGLVNAGEFGPSRRPVARGQPLPQRPTHPNRSMTLHGHSTEFARLWAAASSRWLLPVQDQQHSVVGMLEFVCVPLNASSASPPRSAALATTRCASCPRLVPACAVDVTDPRGTSVHGR